VNSDIGMHDIVQIKVDGIFTHKDGHVWRTFVFVDAKGDTFRLTAFARKNDKDTLLLPHEKVAEVAEVAEVQ